MDSQENKKKIKKELSILLTVIRIYWNLCAEKIKQDFKMDGFIEEKVLFFLVVHIIFIVAEFLRDHDY